MFKDIALNNALIKLKITLYLSLLAPLRSYLQ